MVANKPKWERKAGERPEALFDAALDVFSKNGYRATRLEEVAEAAGVSKGTIYNYFANKEDLFQKALENKINLMLSQTESALDNFQGAASEKLRFYMERAWKRSMAEDWGRFHKLLFGEIANELPELFRIWIRKGTLQSWRIAEGIIKEGQVTGEFRKDADAAGAARFAMAGLTHQALLQFHMGVSKLDHCPTGRILESGLELALRGLKNDKSTGRKK